MWGLRVIAHVRYTGIFFVKEWKYKTKILISHAHNKSGTDSGPISGNEQDDGPRNLKHEWQLINHSE